MMSPVHASLAPLVRGGTPLVRPGRVAAAAALVAAVAVALAAGALPALADVVDGQVAPELRLKDWVQGGPHELRELEGKVVALLFFATIAPDLDIHVPYYGKAVERYGKDGFVMIAITREEKKVVADWVAKKKPAFEVALDDGSWKEYGITGYPYAYVLDMYGEVTWQDQGLKPEQLIPAVEIALKKIKTVRRIPDASPRIEKVFAAIDKADWKTAIKLLKELAKPSADEKDRANAEQVLADIKAIAEERLRRAEVLTSRRDYVEAQAAYASIEKTFEGIEAAVTAAAVLKAWKKDEGVKGEIEAARAFAEAAAAEAKRDFRRAGELLKAIVGTPRLKGTKAGEKAKTRLDELVKTGKVRP